VEGDWDLPNLHALAGTPGEPPGTPRQAPQTPRETSQPPRETSKRPTGGGHRTDGDVRIVPPPEDPDDADPYCHLDRCRAAGDESIDVTLVDCPSGAGPDAAAPLSVADRTLLVTTLSPPALRDTAKTAAMARELDADPIGVVITRTESVPEGVSTFLSAPVLGTVPAVRPPVVSDSRVRAAHRDVVAALQRSHGTDSGAADPTDGGATARRAGHPSTPDPDRVSHSETDRTTSDRRTADVDPSNWSYPR
jgi:septum site-determining protein MinD